MTFAFGQVSINGELGDGLGSSFYTPIDGRLGVCRAGIEAVERLDNVWNRKRGIVAINLYRGSIKKPQHWFTVMLTTGTESER